MAYIRNILFAGVLVLTCFSFINAAEWYLFENIMCKISFPVKPDSDSTEIDSEFGKITLLSHMYEPAESLQDSNLVYGLMETEYPESYVKIDTKRLEDQFFRGAVDGAVKKTEGKLLSEKKINIDKYPGREIHIDYSNGLAIIIMRLYLVKTKLFILQVISYTEKSQNENSNKFMNSFMLK